MGSKLASVYCNTAVIENWTLDTSTEDVHIPNPPEEDDDVYFDQKEKKDNVFFLPEHSSRYPRLFKDDMEGLAKSMMSLEEE